MMVMKRNYYKRKKQEKRIAEPVQFVDFVDDVLDTLAQNPHQAQLAELWNNWVLIVGEELIAYAKPIGERNGTLCVGAENSLQLQEIRMHYEEILARANAFMKAFGYKDFFKKLECSLLKKKKSTLKKKISLPQHLNYYKPPRPKKYGEYIDFKENTSLARCYAAYCAALDAELEK